MLVRRSLPALLVFFAAATAYIRPITDGMHDSGIYLSYMRNFLEGGVRIALYREPAYPLFLALMTKLGMVPEKHIAIVQNLLFIGALAFFLRSLFAERLSRVRALIAACAITAIPTFWITMNGSIYTESIAATSILFMLGGMIRLYSAVVIKRSDGKAVLWFFLILVNSVLLALNKGSFVLINGLFPILAATFFFFFGFEKVRSRKRLVLFFTLLILAGASNRAAVSLWFGLRPGEPVFSKKGYFRIGENLYGRTEYAKRFDFLHDGPGYFLNALSETACRKILGGDQCARYHFTAENSIGQRLNIENGYPEAKYTDAELLELGKRNIKEGTFLQLAFGLLEDSKFFAHHSLNGFAALRMPLIGPIVHSPLMTLLLKVFNLGLYLFIPILLFRNRRRMSGVIERMGKLPQQTRVGTLLYVAYVLTYLSAYLMATSVVRMVFPIAVFLVILNWQAYRIFVSGADGKK